MRVQLRLLEDIIDKIFEIEIFSIFFGGFFFLSEAKAACFCPIKAGSGSGSL